MPHPTASKLPDLVIFGGPRPTCKFAPFSATFLHANLITDNIWPRIHGHLWTLSDNLEKSASTLLSLLQKKPFWLFLTVWALLTILRASLKSSLSVIRSIRYADIWVVSITLSLSWTLCLEKSTSRLVSHLKITIWLFLAILCGPYICHLGQPYSMCGGYIIFVTV